MNRKRVVFSLITLFVLVYVAVGVWISHDTKIILVKAMSGAADYKVYMNDKTYQNINPVTRDMTTIPYVYDKKHHEIGFVFPLHFFFISKAYVNQFYSNGDFGFREPVRLNLKLKSGEWYATDVYIEP